MKLLKSSKLKKVGFLFLVFLMLIYGVLTFQNILFRLMFANKIHAHRVNSIEKLNEVKPKFSGAELDVMFQNNTNSFDVNHPPAKSINLTLSKYIASNTTNKDYKFWLDFKNLNKSNQEKAVFKLDSISSVFNLKKENIIIESSLPQYLNLFLNKGYKTSYYLPAKKSLIKSDSVKSLINTYKTTYISANLSYYSLLKKHYPEQSILSWQTGYNNIYSIKSLQRAINQFRTKWTILNDNKVDVFLVAYKADNGNR